MRLRDKALAWFEYAIVKVVGFVYLELAMTDVDREAIRAMEKMYGRRLSHHEKSGVIAYRIGSEMGKSVRVRSGERRHCGLGTTTNGFCEEGGDACACTCDCAVCIPEKE